MRRLANQLSHTPHTHRVEEPIKYELKYQGMCGIMPCTKTRTEVKIDSKLRTVWENMQVPVCCPGYAETPDRKCAPVCLKSCNSGQCSAPGICKCTPEPTETSPGFVGSTCTRYTCLAVNRWGSKCDLECNCPSNSYCSASTGKCICRTGWRGADCSEECEPSMNCANVELPPIIEPEANVIYDSMAQSQRLESAPRALERDLEDETSQVSKSIANLVAAHMGINLFLIILTSALIFAVFWYKKRLNQMKKELYYGTYSSPASSNDSNYSPNSAYSTNTRSVMSGRPRMPTPLESNFLSKNMTFASATRNILLKGDSTDQNKTSNHRDTILMAPHIESHLIASQRSSEQNIYSDIGSNFSERSYSIKGNSVLPNNTTMLSVSTHSALKEDDGEDNAYKVPRSPSIPAADKSESDQLNLYEEIKPRSSEK